MIEWHYMAVDPEKGEWVIPTYPAWLIKTHAMYAIGLVVIAWWIS